MKQATRGEGKLSLGRKTRDEISSQMGREGIMSQVLPGNCDELVQGLTTKRSPGLSRSESGDIKRVKLKPQETLPERVEGRKPAHWC